ncbi:long-chain fatty acid--CoA ligase [Arthrobacter agilis]|uniref:long-chain-fatty-acid--CoA ligase n=1 Tax=Arthrobacter agilis TaxID=37921 RepID=UPI000B34EA5A|nr:long-chain-fatty-acid--CoA ligase [Arthrobacter agilis]OUM40725.1 long-chain fatty acid--CoA ligase [Arthrobacter agilis]PPB45331.1 long-chain fatty acid--CoA ligase [Arthrobacter agilis]TPV28040.1 long-chain fatty acid--CoA ligase [Arthrobacter agilis]VDR31264.1 Long-chain-fatty-acid--CoA ligase [Arthrobacter agilis]
MNLAGRPWLASYAPGVPRTFVVPEGSLPDLLEDSVRTYRSAVALEFFGAPTTYRELGAAVDRAAAGLRALGVTAGDRVALVLPNCPQHIIAFYAVLRLGAIVVEHNPLYTDRELRHQFEDHGAKVAIVWDRVVPRIQRLPEDIRVTAVVTVDLISAMPASRRLALTLPVRRARDARKALTTTEKLTGPRRTVRWQELLRHKPLTRRHPRPAATDTAVLQYTSGTTGIPKGAVLTHRNLLANAAQGRAWVPGLETGRETVYAVLPMFHAYGLTLCLTFAMSIGAKLVLFPRFDVGLVLDAVKKSPPTFLPAVPPIYERLAAAADERGVDLTSIRFAISGAMNLPQSTVETWEAATGGYLIEGYGLTETSPVAAGNPIGPTRRPGTVGVPFPGTDVRIVDPDEPSTDRSPGEPGELLIRGPQVFQGYWRRPDETHAALIDGEWFRTGDIVRMDDDGFLTIVDRIKELIITGGFNVAPSEVEDVLKTHPSVRDAAVVGLPGRGGGEDVTAVVVLSEGAILDVEDVRSRCRDALAAYKVPRTIVQVEDLPRSLIGKILRREVRTQLLNDGPRAEGSDRR